jgi:hypothetical protein
LPVAVPLLALAYCAWASIGIGAKPLLWTLVLVGAGLPVYLWSLRVQRRAALAAAAAL